VHVFLDGQPAYKKLGLGRDDGLQDIEISIGGNTRFLTLMSTDHGNGIGHDQICFADLQLEPQEKDSDDTQNQRVDELTKQVQELQRQLVAVPEVPRIYSVVPETPPATHVHRRGNPEDQGDEVFPGAISCVSALNASFGERTLTDAQRRIALANWIASSENPLTSRVIVNRLWHHHFGRGLVDTPSDFGLGGSLPSHPELLDWLAEQLIENGWSLKSMHRRICLSRTYRQSSSAVSATNDQEVAALDAGNHLLWRQNARRLDAESVRDAVLHLSGKLNTEMYGPGYRDFEYKEEYAPVYSYVTADRPELWRRSIYRFTVRTTPDQFLATLDCPNAANLTPARNVTTTALQALALMNNDFMLRQSHYMAERVASESDATSDRRIQRAFQLAYARNPSPEEMTAARLLHQQRDLAELCRALLNSNEFHYVD
jgi:hypothetical protein